ncbi:D-2-hydroxyacid dehydrogenase [Paludisphaera mucosa]|uniref:D-2-hydroxyacid dehydrogenase n=1 Tax=Paludisphaera mucosa TaxID=3030827 RepID=A0ABT6F514_9BACT|nr:D-2-hydroxyacid dehydrogenase [Paludisphaera mucosa]
MKIVVLDGRTLNDDPRAWSGLDAFGAVEYHDVTAPDEVAERASGAEVLIINKCPIRADLIAGLPDLRFIAVTATGFDCVDVEAAKGREIVVSNVRGYSTDSVAQVTFALILELTLHVGLHSDAVLAGEWAAQPDFSIRKSPLIELAGKTLGIVGLGRIGRRVAEVAGAFGMNVIAHRPSGKPPAPDDPIPAFALEDLFRRADVVTLHCPLTPKTKGLVNRELLRLAKPTAFLINTGRGPLVVEQDLADALNEGLIAGAGVDVVSREPIDPANPLLKAKNIVITPHIAWATAEARERLMAATVENVAAYAAGKPINLVG